MSQDTTKIRRVHRIQDVDAMSHFAMATTTTATTSKTIDLEADGGWTGIHLNIDIPATALAADKTATVSLEHSDDGETWTALTGMSTSLTGSATGTTAQTVSYAMPLGTKRYVRCKTVSVASSGVATNTKVKFYLTY